MEKPWLANLVDALQAPPAEPAPETSPEEEAPERRSVSAPLPDKFTGNFTGANFTGGTNSRWAPAATQAPDYAPLKYEGANGWNEPWSERVSSRGPVVAVALLVVAALGALIFFYKVPVGRSLVLLGEKLSGEAAQQPVTTISTANASSSAAQPVSTPPAEPPPPARSAAPQQPVAQSDASALAGLTPADLAANGHVAAGSPVAFPAKSKAPTSENSNGRSASRQRQTERPAHGKARAIPRSAIPSPAISTAAISTAAGQAEYQLADAALHQARTPDAKARAATLLWAAVSAGSSDAEIELADVYGRGDGVRKNCEQARILLDAARDKSNPLVGKEQAELRVYGCR